MAACGVVLWLGNLNLNAVMIWVLKEGDSCGLVCFLVALRGGDTVTIVGNRRFRVGCSTIGNSVALWEFKLRYTGLSQLSIRFDRFSFIDTAWGRTSAYQRRVHLTRTPLLHVKGIEGRVSVFCAFETMTFSLNIDCRNFQMWSSFGLLGGHYNPSMNVMLYVLSFSCG